LAANAGHSASPHEKVLWILCPDEDGANDDEGGADEDDDGADEDEDEDGVVVEDYGVDVEAIAQEHVRFTKLLQDRECALPLEDAAAAVDKAEYRDYELAEHKEIVDDISRLDYSCPCSAADIVRRTSAEAHP
jgi:hypothetical protein